jgi:hypothetical protein
LFNGSVDSGSNYNVTKTTTYFGAQFAEVGDGSGLLYKTEYDLAESTDYQQLIRDIGNLADESGAGTLWLFNPSNTTYVKHFYGRSNQYYQDDKSGEFYTAGYIDVTAAITGVQFKMSSGNMDAVIKMYGVG